MIENAADLGMALPGDASTRRCSPTSWTAAAPRAGGVPAGGHRAAELRAPHRVARYLEDTAAVFNRWYDTKECRMLPVGDEPVTPTNEARLVLVHAVRTVLANGLRLLGVSAPERM